MIQDGETGVLTGGDHPVPTNNVTRYNLMGMGVVESLPHLNYARRWHACTSLIIDGETVSKANQYYCFIFVLTHSICPGLPGSRRSGYQWIPL